MTETRTPRELLVQFIRQRLELGQTEWFLDEAGGAELLGRAAARDYTASAPRAVPRARERSSEFGEPAAAGGAGDAFEELRSEVLSCTRCRLAGGRKTVVFGEGDAGADLLVVGEAPGFEEDRSGRPFVGPAGKLLDKMLAAIGFARREVFICNVLKCRPPQNRDPVADEVAACRPYLRKQVELIKPKAICAFGRFAAQTLLETERSLGRLRGARHDFMGIPVVVTYHPAALLRNAQWKRPAWEDLQMLRRIYDELGGRAPEGDRG